MRCSVSLASIYDKNINCQLNYRWNKANRIQNELSKQMDCCQSIGLHIINTQNGLSPSCSDDSDMDNQVLGTDAINKSGILSFENPKYSSEHKNDFEKYIISDGDFFVSRGNTTSLVALASIANINNDIPPTMFPDLMIKNLHSMLLSIKRICHMYLTHLSADYFLNMPLKAKIRLW